MAPRFHHTLASLEVRPRPAEVIRRGAELCRAEEGGAPVGGATDSSRTLSSHHALIRSARR